MEKTLSLSEAKMKLNSLVDDIESKEGEFVITRNGSPVAALVPAALYEGWKETLAIRRDKEFMGEIKKGVARLKRGGKRYRLEEVFKDPSK